MGFCLFWWVPMFKLGMYVLNLGFIEKGWCDSCEILVNTKHFDSGLSDGKGNTTTKQTLLTINYSPLLLYWQP